MATTEQTSTAATPSPDSFESFRAGFHGELIEPGDAGYDDARAVYNGMIDRRPRLIARCADTADVIASVGFARDSGAPLAVRGGGHNAGGLGVWDDAIVIDLSLGGGAHRCGPRPVRVGGGASWGDVDHATPRSASPYPAGCRLNRLPVSRWAAGSAT